ncbi:MAG TPA: acyl-CoA dehydrogenase family protein [Solirubrobacteraceae bacterium]|nr:acyl-CoA dehydrogenase family protein [Solirubrobacteraceae bacterium]
MILDRFPAATLSFGPDEERLRRELREWLSAHRPSPPPAEYAERIARQIEWQAALRSAGFIGLSWPERYGGRGLGLAAEAVLAEELARSDMPELINRIGVYMIGPTLLDFAGEDHQARFLPGMLDASELWCQGFSEPDAGSDLAAVRTTAVRDGDEFVVNGQKVWTSRAGIAHWCAALVRTDPEQRRHRGLTMAIVDMRHPGITVRPLPQILGEPHFSEVFFEDVRVPAGDVIGAVGDGWRVAMQMLSYERGLFVLERQIRLRRRLDELARLVIEHGRETDTSVQERIGRVHIELQLLEAQVYRTLASQLSGTLRPGATSVDKLLLSHVYQELFALAADLIGREEAMTMNEWTHDLLESRAVSIYGGTTEVQHGIVARQLLGLSDAR